MELKTRIKPGTKVKLDDYDTSFTGGLSKEEGARLLGGLSQEIAELQELLYAAGQNSLLIVLQGMDTSGKDGTIKHVMSDVNPTGCRVEAFKKPTENELAHDYLWRIHQVTPARGMMTIFNRSQYEDVIIVRVRNLVPKAVWKRRYDHIKHFEQMLSDSGTIILKFYLHISYAEQEKRLKAREEETEKAWKLSASDWEERRMWVDYMRAYEDAITRCTTDYAPWHIIPADKKWFRNLAVAQAIAEHLRPYRMEWEKYLSKLAETRIAELNALRNREEGSSNG